MGSHAKHVNVNTASAVFIGNFECGDDKNCNLNKPTPSALDSAAKLMAYLSFEHGFDINNSIKRMRWDPYGLDEYDKGLLIWNKNFSHEQFMNHSLAGKDVQSISYHREVAQGIPKRGTLCPGKLITEKLPIIRKKCSRRV